MPGPAGIRFHPGNFAVYPKIRSLWKKWIVGSPITRYHIPVAVIE
ncbi:hypothetical protein [Azospirillum palustre]